jgi:leucyl/phenylalanyl-tRNA--protein transferase
MATLSQTEAGTGSAPALNRGEGRPAPDFREAAPDTLRRLALGLLYPLRPKRLDVLPALLGLSAEALLNPAGAERRFAHPRYRGWQGLVGVSDDLSPETVLARYAQGLFPFCHVGPMKWWSPDVRAVQHPRETRIEKNVRRLIRQGKFRVTFDTDFAAVMRACAEPREGKTPLTWITPAIQRAFWALHRQGHAHSVELWDADGNLVGGLYGLAVGNVYFGESQFTRVRNTSKIAVAILHCHLDHWGFTLLDSKWLTPHLTSLGFRTVPREEFLTALEQDAHKPGRVGRWSVDPSLDVSAWLTST